MARPTSPFALMPYDLIALQGWLRMSTLEQSLAQRARILLLLANGLTPKAVSEQLQVTPPTVFKWRKRYLEAGIKGLAEAIISSVHKAKLSVLKNKLMD
uniref:helix-turn-helix domain-containing protein n=1 Tax=Pseudomonas sp. JAI120 TaxID=2723063 RepID=UPI0030DA904E